VVARTSGICSKSGARECVVIILALEEVKLTWMSLMGFSVRLKGGRWLDRVRVAIIHTFEEVKLTLMGFTTRPKSDSHHCTRSSLIFMNLSRK